nr:hypothetical protein [Tanacetum cinerariifolium]
MGNKELSTIPEKESDEFIKSSIEDLVSIPSESEDTFGSDSNDDESLFDEAVLEDNIKIYSNPLFEFDDEYISSDVNPLFHEVLENIENRDSYDSNLDEPALLVTPLFDTSEDVYFDPSGNIDEIDDFLDIDTFTNIKDGYHDSEGDILYLESLLSDDTIPSLPFEVFLDHDPKGLKDESDIDDLKNMVKVFDPEISKKKFSPTYVSVPFKDRHYLIFTYVIRIFLPYFTYSVDSPFLLSFGSEDTIFDPGISVFYFSLEPMESHWNESFICFNVYPNILNESSMEICSSTRFIPNITMIWAPLIYPEPCYNQDFNSPQYFQDVPQQYPCCDDCGVTHDAYQCQPLNEVYNYGQNSCYDSTSIGFDQSQPQQYTVNHPIFNAHNDSLDSQIQLNSTLAKLKEQMTSITSWCEIACQFVQKKLEEKQLEEEQEAKAQNWKLPVCYDDDDDEESSKSLKDNIISELPPEAEGKNGCDVLAGFTTFSNALFDADYDSDSSDNQSLLDEDVPKKIYSNPLFDEEIILMEIDPHSFNAESDLIKSMLNNDSSITIPSKIDSLLEEFSGNGYSQMDKNKAKRTKPSMGLERA